MTKIIERLLYMFDTIPLGPRLALLIMWTIINAIAGMMVACWAINHLLKW